MTLLNPFSPNQTDAEKPLDEQLMQKQIQENLEDLALQVDAISSGGGGGALQFKVNGNLSRLKSLISSNIENGQGLDGAYVTALKKYTSAKLFIKKNGETGQTKADVKRHRQVNQPLKSINHKASYLTQSVGIIGSPLTTLSVAKRTAQSPTQTITRTEAAESVTSIIDTGDGLNFKINTSGAALSPTWKVGSIVVISSANAANNGEHEIKELNYEGSPSVLLEISGGVEESGLAASLNLNRFAYTFLAVADATAYKVGENMVATGHTLAANDGIFTIDDVNASGNDLVIYNNSPGADTQGAPLGAVDTERYVYTFPAPVSALDYLVGQTCNASSHTSGLNDGMFEIVELNESGNNLVIRNPAGVSQAGVAGVVNTNLWTYALDAVPADVTVGDILRFENHTSSANDLNAEVIEIARSGGNNVVIFNEVGAVQAGVAGEVLSELMILEFFIDQSAFYDLATFSSIAGLSGIPNADMNGQFAVEEINYNFGFNIVIKNILGTVFSDPIGEVETEIRSLFSTLPIVAAGQDFSIGTGAVLIDGNIEADSMIMLDILELPEGGLPEDVSLDLE